MADTFRAAAAGEAWLPAIALARLATAVSMAFWCADLAFYGVLPVICGFWEVWMELIFTLLVEELDWLTLPVACFDVTGSMMPLTYIM